jgi:hypothetical protein
LGSGLVLVSAWASPAWAASPSVVGEFRYAGGKKQRERFEAAVEEVVAELNMLIRGLARSKIMESQTPSAAVEILQTGSDVIVRRTGAPEIRGPANGTPFRWKNRYRDELELRMRLNGAKLEIRFKGEKSRTTTTYTASEDGSRMTLRTTIKDPRLPKPLRLSFAYKRK